MKDQAEFVTAAEEVSLLWIAAINAAGQMGGSTAASAMLLGVISQTLFRISAPNWSVMTTLFDGPVPDDGPKSVPPFVKALNEFRNANEVHRAEMQLAGKIPFPKPPKKKE